MNPNSIQPSDDVIVSLASGQGSAAIGVIRLSGKNTLSVCEKMFFNKKGKAFSFSTSKPNTMHFVWIMDKKTILDEAMVVSFKAPRSYTGENSVEIYCHGSTFVEQKIIELSIHHGARMANPGEFTLRAFLNGKMDLAQADAVADLIASNSASTHKVAMQQMRGGYSHELKELRDQLIQFASLIELELDFSQEDVLFADRKQLLNHLTKIKSAIQKLIASFGLGNVIKNGIPVAIVGKPNSGKSTLLNALFNEERAIVSDIAGTTRDTIEEELIIEGVKFRFIDTAGLRESQDAIEKIGVSRTFQKMKQSSAVIYLFDVHEITPAELRTLLAETRIQLENEKTKLIPVGNKIDHENAESISKEFSGFEEEILFISAKEKTNLAELKSKLTELFNLGILESGESIVTNVRHIEALTMAEIALQNVFEAIEKNTSGELLSADIREALHQIGIITGEVSNDDLLKSIFGRFCIGK